MIVQYGTTRTHFTQLSNTPNLTFLGEWEIPGFPINVGTIGAILYSSLYILMEPVAGLLLAPIILYSTAFANRLLDLYGSTANKWAIVVHVTSWIAQFIGHGAFEGRAPALLDNLVQALFLAPFFVWFEILFSLGYRPELKARINAAVGAEVKKFKNSKDVNLSAKVKKET
jgi:uncharacterized membrane protein YGL010W